MKNTTKLKGTGQDQDEKKICKRNKVKFVTHTAVKGLTLKKKNSNKPMGNRQVKPIKK